MSSLIATLRKFIADRRDAPRYKIRRKARLLFSVSVVGAPERMMPLEGYTRDVSESGLALIVRSIRIGDSYLTDKNFTLRIVLLDLPTGQIELYATPTRYEELEGEAEKSHLICARITKIKDGDRARFTEYLRTLP